ncbi:MAG: hypothetical protein ABW167_13235 [Baekduia sp.]
MPDDPQFPPAGWSVERPFDFGDVLDREPPTYEDDGEDQPEQPADD